jgi:putative transcriptional regulator
MSRRNAEDGATHRVSRHLGHLLERRDMTLVELAERTGATVANLSVLENDRARAIRFSTLTGISDALDCQPGDLLNVTDHDASAQHEAVDTVINRIGRPVCTSSTGLTRMLTNGAADRAA